MPGLPLCHEHPKNKGVAVTGQGSGSTEQLLSILESVPDYQLWDYLAGWVDRDLTAHINTCPRTPQNAEMPTFLPGRLQGPPLVTMVPEEPNLHNQQIALTLPGTQNPLRSHPFTMDYALPLGGTRINSQEKQCWCWFAHVRIDSFDWKSWFPTLWYGPCFGEWTVPQTPTNQSPIPPSLEEFWWSDSRTRVGGGLSHPPTQVPNQATRDPSLWGQGAGIEPWEPQDMQVQPNITLPLVEGLILEEGGRDAGGFGRVHLPSWTPMSWTSAEGWSGEGSELGWLRRLMRLHPWTQVMAQKGEISLSRRESRTWAQWLAGALASGDRTPGWLLWRNATGGTTNVTMRPNAYHPSKLNVYFLVRGNLPKVLRSPYMDPPEFLKENVSIKSFPPSRPTPYHILSKRGYIMPLAYTMLLLVFFSRLGSGKSILHPRVICGNLFVRMAKMPLFLFALMIICMVPPIPEGGMEYVNKPVNTHHSVLRLRGGGPPDDKGSDNGDNSNDDLLMNFDPKKDKKGKTTTQKVHFGAVTEFGTPLYVDSRLRSTTAEEDLRLLAGPSSTSNSVLNNPSTSVTTSIHRQSTNAPVPPLSAASVASLPASQGGSLPSARASVPSVKPLGTVITPTVPSLSGQMGVASSGATLACTTKPTATIAAPLSTPAPVMTSLITSGTTPVPYAGPLESRVSVIWPAKPLPEPPTNDGETEVKKYLSEGEEDDKVGFNYRRRLRSSSTLPTREFGESKEEYEKRCRQETQKYFSDKDKLLEKLRRQRRLNQEVKADLPRPPKPAANMSASAVADIITQLEFQVEDQAREARAYREHNERAEERRRLERNQIRAQARRDKLAKEQIMEKLARLNNLSVDLNENAHEIHDLLSQCRAWMREDSQESLIMAPPPETPPQVPDIRVQPPTIPRDSTVAMSPGHNPFPGLSNSQVVPRVVSEQKASTPRISPGNPAQMGGDSPSISPIGIQNEGSYVSGATKRFPATPEREEFIRQLSAPPTRLIWDPQTSSYVPHLDKQGNPSMDCSGAGPSNYVPPTTQDNHGPLPPQPPRRDTQSMLGSIMGAYGPPGPCFPEQPRGGMQLPPYPVNEQVEGTQAPPTPLPPGQGFPQDPNSVPKGNS